MNNYRISDEVKNNHDEDITLSKCYFKEVATRDDGSYIIFNSDNILQKYFDELRQTMYTKTFTEEEFRKYKYNPKVLSYDLYGNTELWFLILYMNQMKSVTEFNRMTIKIFYSSILGKINEIMDMEAVNIRSNQDKLTKSLI